MIIHRRGVAHQLRRHLGNVVVTLLVDGVDPVGRCGGPAAAHALEQRGDAGADIADHGGHDLDVGIHFLGLDVDLDEFLRRIAPGLALAVRQQPVEAGADQHDDVGVLQHGRACRTGRLHMGVGQQALGHAHLQERRAGLFDEGADLVVGLRIGGTLAENDEGAFRPLEHVERTLDGGWGRDLGRRSVDHFHQRLCAGSRVHHLTEKFCGQVEIDTAGTARDRGTDRARQADADVGRMQHAKGGLAERLGNRQLVHLFIVALLQVDDLALGGARDQDHREAVGGGVGERGEAVEEAGRRDGEADAWFLGQVAGNGSGVAGILLVAEREHANTLGLHHAAEVRDRDARHTIDGVDAVELERIDDEMKAICQFLRQLLLGARCFGLGRGIQHGLHLPDRFGSDDFSSSSGAKLRLGK